MAQLAQRMDCVDARTSDMARSMRREQLSTAVKAAAIAAGGAPLARGGELAAQAGYGSECYSSPLGRRGCHSEVDLLREEVGGPAGLGAAPGGCPGPGRLGRAARLQGGRASGRALTRRGAPRRCCCCARGIRRPRPRRCRRTARGWRATTATCASSWRR